MKEARYAGRVGLFVVAGLVLAVLLVLAFSKGLSVFTPSYELTLKAVNVGGLKKGANVLLSGLAIGNVVGADVDPEGRGVLIRLRLNARYRIHGDARFVIEQIGFLGDMFVAIYPQANQTPLLEAGDTVQAEEPVNLQEVVRSAGSVIAQASQGLKTLNAAVVRLDQTVFAGQTLTNVTTTIANLRRVSDQAAVLVEHVDRLVQTNSPPISLTVSNLVRFSEDMEKLAQEMHLAVVTNRVELTKAVQNLERSSAALDRLTRNVEAGQGLAGSLLKDEDLQLNVSLVASNLAVLSSNLNRYGLLYKPRPPKPDTDKPPWSIHTGRNPFE